MTITFNYGIYLFMTSNNNYINNAKKRVDYELYFYQTGKNV